MNQDQFIDQLFQLFRNRKTGLFSVEQFFSALKDSNAEGKAQILKQSISQWQSKELTIDELADFFDQKFSDNDFVQQVCIVMDKQQKKHFLQQDLVTINQQQKIGLTNDQIALIIKYAGSGNKITFEQMKQALQSK